ncbi:hypothetical protein RUM43_003532 [Polyplax serrata]|uniref:Uncharacterized protein n=1 Tax=Polyplax serrata TaxID=468196 RepID=A0AAN8NVK3_POLSC
MSHTYVDKERLDIPNNIQPADPKYNICFWALTYFGTCCAKVKFIWVPRVQRVLQKTRLGWIVRDPILERQETSNVYGNNTQALIYNQSQRFWEIDDNRQSIPCNIENAATRDNNGHILVTLGSGVKSSNMILKGPIRNKLLTVEQMNFAIEILSWVHLYIFIVVLKD